MSSTDFYGGGGNPTITPDLNDDSSEEEITAEAFRRNTNSHSTLSFLQTAKSEAMDMIHGSFGQHFFIKKDAWGQSSQGDMTGEKGPEEMGTLSTSASR